MWAAYGLLLLEIGRRAIGCLAAGDDLVALAWEANGLFIAAAVRLTV